MVFSPTSARLAEFPGERLPAWVTAKKAPVGAGFRLKSRLRQARLTTVCEEARCPNLADCFGHGVATFMLLGSVCTRTCGFCAVAQGTPQPVDVDEPARIVEAARSMGLRHVVVTSVDRDDLADGGSDQFVAVIEQLRQALPAVTVEVLTPDFGGDLAAVRAICDATPAVYNHNLETVPRLYDVARKGASYTGSLAHLRQVADYAPEIVTKSGVMVGLGERDDELHEVFADLADSGVQVLTIGQYLRPGRKQLPVDRYVTPDGFSQLRKMAMEMGFRQVVAGPLVRSSFHAGDTFNSLGMQEVVR